MKEKEREWCGVGRGVKKITKNTKFLTRNFLTNRNKKTNEKKKNLVIQLLTNFIFIFLFKFIILFLLRL